MFHVAICDDEIVVCTQLEKYLDGYKSKGAIGNDITAKLQSENN